MTSRDALELAGSAHLIYEVGPPDPQRTAGRIRTQSGTADKVSPEHFGLPHLECVYPQGNTQTHQTRVPVSDLFAAQPYVYRRHVENLATVPASTLELAHLDDPIEAIALPDGRILLGHGHHRACAALLRQDRTLLLTLETVDR